MKKNKTDLYRTALEGVRCFYMIVIAIEVITYTISFLISGLAKKDIFNVMEGKETTFGITSLWILILLNTMIPLGINCVKQMNTALVAKLTVRLEKNVKQNLLVHVLQRKIGMKKRKSDGELISLFRNECEDISAYFLQFYYQLPKIVLSIAILIMMFYINPVFAAVSLIPTSGNVTLTDCDAQTIHIETISGNVSAALTSSKTFSVQTVSGDVRTPQGTTGDLCEISTVSGNITCTIQ